MSTFKCKMCGGTLEIQNNETVIECTYCGTMQTLPKLDDERKANLYDRANHFRRNNEFDKAMGIYEQILNEDQTDAETYWSLVLCRYGIEYVEDPTSHKRIPTVNRAQFTSILADEDYKSALQYADSYQRHLYEQEAKAIDEIQKGILAISQQEEPFDVFICYKETDAAGRRTPDSVLANDLYHQLTQEGFRVFFSRITLEDKLGQEYEPYIFAALNSAKAMVVLGTKPEYFNAVWVKNEWSRYLSLIKKGDKKTLIPAYKDMDPYDLPEEFSHLQAQDMSKLGFMQDLIRGIKKIVQTEAPKATVVKETVVTGGNVSIAPLLKRAFMFLEDGEWASADEYCEKVLDMDPECAEAYLGKLMAELRVRKQESLKDCAEPFDDRNNYQKALRFGDEKLKEELTTYTKHIKDRNEQARLEDIYSRAQKTMSTAEFEDDYKEAVELFESITEFKDSTVLAKECREKAEAARKDAILAAAKEKMVFGDISSFEAAIQLLDPISDWEEADELISVCLQMIEEMKDKAEKERLEKEIFRKDVILAKAKSAMVGGRTYDYEVAIDLLQSVHGWKDADELVKICTEKIEEIKIAKEIAEEREKSRLIAAKKRNRVIAVMLCVLICLSVVWYTVIVPYNKYNEALRLMSSGELDDAYKIFMELGSFKDSVARAGSIRISKNVGSIENYKVKDSIKLGVYEQNNNYSDGPEEIEWVVLEVEDDRVLVISKYALDCKKYSDLNNEVTWQTCTLRKWLNESFWNSAFSNVEKEMIPTINVDGVQDKVFLLSVTEADRFLTTLKCEATPYALTCGTIDEDGDTIRYWLRSTGYRGKGFAAYAVYGRYSDKVVSSGENVISNNFFIRPAIWIQLND